MMHASVGDLFKKRSSRRKKKESSTNLKTKIMQSPPHKRNQMQSPPHKRTHSWRILKPFSNPISIWIRKLSQTSCQSFACHLLSPLLALFNIPPLMTSSGVKPKTILKVAGSNMSKAKSNCHSKMFPMVCLKCTAIQNVYVFVFKVHFAKQFGKIWDWGNMLARFLVQFLHPNWNLIWNWFQNASSMCPLVRSAIEKFLIFDS